MKERLTISSLVLLQIVLVNVTLTWAQGSTKRTIAPSYEARVRAVTPAKQATAQIEPALQVRLAKKFTFSPGYVQTVVRVQPHRDNRLLRVSLDSADFYRSSDVQLDGAAAATSHFFNWTQLPPGHYEIMATLFGPEGPREVTKEVLEVVGSAIVN